MPDTHYSPFLDFHYILIFVLSLVITIISVSILLWKAKQRAIEDEAQALARDAKKQLRSFEDQIMDGALWKDFEMTRVADDGLGTAPSLGGDEWQSTEGSSEDDRRSRVKASKRRKPRSQQLGLPEDFRSFMSSLDGLALTPSGTPLDGFKTAHEPAETGGNVVEEAMGALSDLSKLEAVHDPLLDGENHAFLPQEKQRNTQGEDIGGPEPIKAFRTTEDGVLHVDNNVNNNGFNDINVFDSRNRGTLDEKLGSPICEDLRDAIRTNKISMAKLEEQYKSMKVKMDPQKSQSSSSSNPESPPQASEAILPKTRTSKRTPTEIPGVLVLSSCKSAWEAQKYIDHACKDDPDVTKTLKKQCITAFLEYRKELDIFDPYGDKTIESLKNGFKEDLKTVVADLKFKASGKSANIENKTTPVTTAVKASNPGPAGPLQCMFFSKLPPEIRLLVYRRILTTKARLNAGAEIEKRAFNLTTDDNDSSHISGIDSAVMRTCRKMYHETLPVLYSENKFVCRTPEQLKAFQEGDLETALGEAIAKQRLVVF